MNIILIGPPASGKGTQAKLLKEKFGFVHLSTGDMLREISSKQTELAKEIKFLIDNGHFVSDELIIEVVKNKLNKIKSQYQNNGTNSCFGILFDGFPRTIFQAKALEEMIKIDYIIEISVSKNEIVNRVLDRTVCTKCGKSHILSKLKENFCDVCGAEVLKRKDDTKEIAESRFDDYMTKTYPIVEYFKSHNGYHKIDGEKDTDLLFEEICKIIEKRKV